MTTTTSLQQRLTEWADWLWDPLNCVGGTLCIPEFDPKCTCRKEAALLREVVEYLAEITAQRDNYRTLAGIGAWHNDCRPNRHQAARELQKQQAVINKLADTISESREALRALVAKIELMQAPLDACIVISQVHGVPYTGPNWSQELTAAKELLGDPAA